MTPVSKDKEYRDIKQVMRGRCGAYLLIEDLINSPSFCLILTTRSKLFTQFRPDPLKQLFSHILADHVTMQLYKYRSSCRVVKSNGLLSDEARWRHPAGQRSAMVALVTSQQVTRDKLPARQSRPMK